MDEETGASRLACAGEGGFPILFAAVLHQKHRILLGSGERQIRHIFPGDIGHRREACLAKQPAPMAPNPHGARTPLEPRVFARKATSEEAGLLWNVCKAMKDKDCRAKVDELYPGLPH